MRLWQVLVEGVRKYLHYWIKMSSNNPYFFSNFSIFKNNVPTDFLNSNRSSYPITLFKF